VFLDTVQEFTEKHGLHCASSFSIKLMPAVKQAGCILPTLLAGHKLVIRSNNNNKENTHTHSLYIYMLCGANILTEAVDAPADVPAYRHIGSI
jgi:hypothetical protein